MTAYTCPACGAPGAFQSAISVYAVCPYCQSMILRHDVDVEAFGRMASLPADMSPLQVGSRGVHQGVAFSLAGRLKIGWRDGVWNEWFMILEDGRNGWLAEAQGFFAVSFERPLQENGRPTLNRDFDKWKPKPGERLNIGQTVYEVADIKDTICLGSEGELPFLANRGRKAVSIDLEGMTGFASVEIQRDGVRLYQGNYVEWGDLKFSDTRPLEGW